MPVPSSLGAAGLGGVRQAARGPNSHPEVVGRAPPLLLIVSLIEQSMILVLPTPLPGGWVQNLEFSTTRVQS